MKNNIDNPSKFLPLLLMIGSAMRKLPISHYLFYCIVVLTGVMSIIKRYATVPNHIVTVNDLVGAVFIGTLLAFTYWCLIKFANLIGLYVVFIHKELWELNVMKASGKS